MPPRLPTFRQLQWMGWAAFYVLVLLANLPFQKGAMWKDALNVGLFVGSMLLASCLLRPICRSLVRRSLPWLALEIRACAWSLVAGAVAALTLNLAILIFQPFDWSELLVDFVESSVVLFLWCSLYFSLKQWRQAAEERERLLRAESEAREARLSALRYQLNPHFLFNSLNAVSTLILDGNAPAATRMLAQIGDLLRTTLDNTVTWEIPLWQEIAFTERYLAIEQTRLGERLCLAYRISPDTLDAVVPNLLLQPLVENAVRHGIAPLVAGGTIAVESRQHGDRLRIVIRNTGEAKPANEQAWGVGLTNTAERLKTLYGSEQRFALEWPAGGGCEAIVELPFRRCEQPQEAMACAH